MMKSLFVIFSVWILAITGSIGQGLPSTSITLFDFNIGESAVMSNPVYLTGFNPKGYNNQPSFFDNEILYLTSDWQAKGQTDILKLNLKAKTILKVTDTEESEYSPTLTPDGRSFSTITVPVSQSKDAAQYLWKYPLDRSESGNALSYDIDNVGYHTWLTSNQVALFLVGSPHQLVILNISTGQTSAVDSNVGRCFRLNQKNELIYVHKAAHNIWYLKSYNLTTGIKNIIGETKTGSEDFALLSDDSIIMCQGSKVFQMKDVGGWNQLSDLSEFKINNITRIALRNNKIALVHAS